MQNEMKYYLPCFRDDNDHMKATSLLFLWNKNILCTILKKLLQLLILQLLECQCNVACSILAY